MSFMDKITSRPRDARADTGAYDSQFDDVVTAYPEGSARDTQAQRTGHTLAPDLRTGYEAHDSSIISEVTPSEMAGDFSETRMQDTAAGEPAKGAALPLIGHMQPQQQQRQQHYHHTQLRWRCWHIAQHHLIYRQCHCARSCRLLPDYCSHSQPLQRLTTTQHTHTHKSANV